MVAIELLSTDLMALELNFQKVMLPVIYSEVVANLILVTQVIPLWWWIFLATIACIFILLHFLR